MSPSSRATRLASLISSALLVTGSLIFTAGGAGHPKASTAFGTVGGEAFYRAFAAHVHHQSNWIPIHVLILLGPVLWALGAPHASGSAWPNDPIDRSGGAVLEGFAARSLLLGAGLWTVAFVLDGFVAPHTAAAIAGAAPADVASLLVTFRVHQVTMVRLGLFAWILVGLAMALYGAAMLVRARLATWRGALGALGILVGLWPAVAALSGEFDPGPFTSNLWNLTALATAFWFAAFGLSLLRRERAPAAQPAPHTSSELALQH